MDKNPITKHAMGMQAELGALYDSKTGTLYSGYSPWKKKQLDASQIIIPMEDTKLTISSSLEETRKNSNLDLEASVGVDFGLAKLGGSSKYLQSKDIECYEARVDITCIKTNQVRHIPMETLMEMSFVKESLRNCPGATHFVGEVIEGATGNITLVKKCTSKEESNEVSASLEAALKLEASPHANVGHDLHKKRYLKTEELQIKVEGAINEPISSFEVAVQIGPKLPKLLKSHNNTLTMKLFPISLLNTDVEVKVVKLDECLLEHLSSTLKEGKLILGLLWELVGLELTESFPKLKKQYTNFIHAYSRCILKFKQTICEHLPKMKDGSLSSKQLELHQDSTRDAIRLMEKQIAVAETFLTKKQIERQKLTATFQDLQSEGFQNYFKSPVQSDSLLSTAVKITLNFTGNGIDRCQHKLEGLLENSETDITDQADIEWFEDDRISHIFLESFEKMREMKKENDGRYQNYKFGFGAVVKACKPTESFETTETCIGDIISTSRGKSYIVTNHTVESPSDVEVTSSTDKFVVTYKQSQAKFIPDSSLYVRWRPIQSISSGQIWDSMERMGTEVEIKTYSSAALQLGTKYEIQAAVKNVLGVSSFTKSFITSLVGLTQAELDKLEMLRWLKRKY